MAEFVTVFKISHIPDGAIIATAVRGKRKAVANAGGTYYAFDDACTHRQCSLADLGKLAGAIECGCHHAEFDLQTGKVLGPPAASPIMCTA